MYVCMTESLILSFLLSMLHRYENNLLVEYNIQCKEDQWMFINVTHLDIQGKDCDDGKGNKRCFICL